MIADTLKHDCRRMDVLVYFAADQLLLLIDLYFIYLLVVFNENQNMFRNCCEKSQ